jgi:hypothetical protein
MFSSFLGRPLVLAATALLISWIPAHAQGPGDCGEWTPWNPVHPLAVTWSWRMCRAPAERYDIQWRFANNGREDIEFRYQLFTGSVSECGERSRGHVFASGKIRLSGAEVHDRYSGRKTLRQTGFQTRFILYLCLLEVVQTEG